MVSSGVGGRILGDSSSSNNRQSSVFGGVLWAMNFVHERKREREKKSKIITADYSRLILKGQRIMMGRIHVYMCSRLELTFLKAEDLFQATSTREQDIQSLNTETL